MKHRSDDRRRKKDQRETRPRNAPPVRAAPNESAVFGVLPVLEKLRANPRRVEKIMIAEGAREHRLSDIAELARENGILIDRVSREVLDRVVGRDRNHQGVAAVAAAADYTDIDEILNTASAVPLFVVLDGVEDPRNFGAILRTAECSGVDGVVIPERRAVGLTETVAKSSAGASEHIKVGKTANINRFIEELKERNIWVVGTSGDAEIIYTDWDWTQPSALVLGNEGHGLHRLVAENCDVLVKIPLHGKIDSLNVSVAAGVVLFEARRQRGGNE